MLQLGFLENSWSGRRMTQAHSSPCVFTGFMAFVAVVFKHWLSELTDFTTVVTVVFKYTMVIETHRLYDTRYSRGQTHTGLRAAVLPAPALRPISGDKQQ